MDRIQTSGIGFQPAVHSHQLSLKVHGRHKLLTGLLSSRHYLHGIPSAPSSYSSPVRAFKMRRILAILILCFCPFAFAKGTPASGSHPPSSSSSHSKKSSSASEKTVHVKGYYRKDGTYVAPYDRRPPGTSTTSSSSSSTTGTSASYRSGYMAKGFSAHPTVARDKNGRIKRSKAARDAFMRQRPCPSTGKASGPCPGYVVDHVQALECGGADAPGNMQWQTVAEAKAKDRIEGNCR